MNVDNFDNFDNFEDEYNERLATYDKNKICIDTLTSAISSICDQLDPNWYLFSVHTDTPEVRITMTGTNGKIDITEQIVGESKDLVSQYVTIRSLLNAKLMCHTNDRHTSSLVPGRTIVSIFDRFSGETTRGVVSFVWPSEERFWIFISKDGILKTPPETCTKDEGKFMSFRLNEFGGEKERYCKDVLFDGYLS